MVRILKAETQYADMVGDSQIDGHTGPLIHELVRKCKITDEYLPIAVSVYIAENNFFHASIFGCLKATYGQNIDQLSHRDNIKAKKFDVDIGREEFFKLAKRFNVTLRLKKLQSVVIEYEDE